ncbi:AMP-binding protein [Shewanella surugensis]|uniref:Long-chain-fatty-acid--CoA ligase n=1 Tax=Shewanella surugensis TaxID=212020 RepID=A0ABT0L9Y4_9GAMM|nr:AMP-binding protein [Shewanella surugensis]MCL1124507.1 AMP-binding protein [Shewanella surugensis]
MHPFDAAPQRDLAPYPSLIHLIEDTCARFGSKTAYVCLGHDISFNEIEQYSRQFAAYLQQYTELKVGDRVAIQLPNITQFVIAAYGAIRAGFVLVNTNPMYTDREMLHQFNDSGAKLLVTLSDNIPKLNHIVNNTSISVVIATHPLDLITPQPQAKSEFNHFRFMDVLKAGGKHLLQTVTVSNHHLAALQYTGGTTGLSKGAMLSHGNLIANAAQLAARLSSHINEGEEIFVAPLPIYHIYAFMVNLILYFERGACSVFIPNPKDIPSFIQTLTKYRFTGFAGLNTLFVGLCQQDMFRALDFSALKVTISGGTALTQFAADLWYQTTGCTISEGYGLSETSPVVSLNTPGREKIGTIGKPLLGTHICIIDDNESEVASGQAGELAVSGPQVMSGYWQQECETKKVMTKNGFFKTGDIAIALTDGFHQIVDRKKDIVIVSGFNVYPNEIENVLSLHGAVLESAVIGVSGKHSDETVKAFIVLTPSAQQNHSILQEIKQHCTENLTPYKIPKLFEFVDALPKSSVGKILRRALR